MQHKKHKWHINTVMQHENKTWKKMKKKMKRKMKNNEKKTWKLWQKTTKNENKWKINGKKQK